MMDVSFIFDGKKDFEERALKVFEFQRTNSPVYGRFVEALGLSKVERLSEIPLMPVQAFRDAEVFCGEQKPDLFFQSSGTTGMQRSRHFVQDPKIYHASIRLGFDLFYGEDDWVFLAYTPGYQDNPHSSLIYMLRFLIEGDGSGLSHFLTLNAPLDQKLLEAIQKSGRRLMLFGAAFGLMDLAENHPQPLPEGSIIMETGGMKTLRREISRDEMHQRLSEAFEVPLQAVHSEY
jgi:hypothetical protein